MVKQERYLRIDRILYFKLKDEELDVLLKIEGFDLEIGNINNYFGVHGPDIFKNDNGIWFWQYIPQPCDLNNDGGLI